MGLMIGGCEGASVVGDGSSSAQAPAPLPVLSATIGPEGGTLAGRAGTAFEGVRLVIPSGALAARTEVRMVPVIDTTALPTLAERVGQHYRIEPLGTALAMPASLTLPVDRARVAEFARGDGDVKVWARSDGAFRIVEPTATAAGSVTIPISQFNIAAAGVQLPAGVQPVCGLTEDGFAGGCNLASIGGDLVVNPDPPQRINVRPCIGSDPRNPGFCLESIELPANTLARDVGFLVESEVLYLPTGTPLTALSSPTLSWSRIDLTPDRESDVDPTSTASAGVTSVPLVDQVAFARRAQTNGTTIEELWSGHVDNRRRFRVGTTSSEAFSPDTSGRSCGVFRGENETIIHTTPRTVVVINDPQGVGVRRAIPGVPADSTTCLPAAAGRGAETTVWLARREGTGPIQVKRYRAVTVSGRPTLIEETAPTVTLPAVVDGSATTGPSAITSIAVNPRTGRLLISGHHSVPSMGGSPRFTFGVWTAAPGETATPVFVRSATGGSAAEAFLLGRAVWGSDDAIWIPNMVTPELIVIDPGQSPQSVLIAQAGTPEFLARRPRFVRALEDRSVIVVTSDGRFVRLRRTAACPVGFGDCDGNLANGCEANLATSATSCGLCGRACGAGIACQAGVCQGAAQVVSGLVHTCARLSDGVVRCWGSNSGGQLGDGSTTLQAAPVSVMNLGGPAAEIAAGGEHTCARLMDGTVRCWGENDEGQVGDGSGTRRVTAVVVPGLSSVVGITAGLRHTCARLMDGTVRCWGRNDEGQVGDGSNTDRPAPVAVGGLTGVVEVRAGALHTCARLMDGTVRCWGRNLNGELGDGSLTSRPTPAAVMDLTNVTALSAGMGLHSCARLADSTVRCWGDNSEGQLGDGTTLRRRLPVTVAGLNGVAQLTIGGDHTCARLVDGTLRCWGDNASGQIGDGTFTSRPAPTPLLRAFTLEVSAGGGHTCARMLDGTVECWGLGSSGQRGDRTTSAVRVPSLTLYTGSTDEDLVVQELAAGGSHTCARQANAGTRCWGNNSRGQLGFGTETSTPTPSRVVNLTNGAQISAGRQHTCARLSTNQVRCWGNNEHGQLGNGATDDSARPVDVAGLSDVAEVRVGGNHSCARLTGGAVRCWGLNATGQLGVALGSPQATPVAVAGLDGMTVVEIGAGEAHSCARTTGGQVFCWGSNNVGQLGDGSTTASSATPVRVAGISDAVELRVGFSHTCARLMDNTVQCWGANSFGQVGSGVLSAAVRSPVPVMGLVGVRELRTGGSHTCARSMNNTVRCWGRNIEGQLGDGSASNRAAPVAVSDLCNVEELALGGSHTCARMTGSVVLCWGSDGSGQLGRGALQTRSAPVTVVDLLATPVRAPLCPAS